MIENHFEHGKTHTFPLDWIACFEKRHKRTTLNDGKQFDLAKMQKHPFKQLYVSQTVPKSK